MNQIGYTSHYAMMVLWVLWNTRYKNFGTKGLTQGEISQKLKFKAASLPYIMKALVVDGIVTLKEDGYHLSRRWEDKKVSHILQGIHYGAAARSRFRRADAIKPSVIIMLSLLDDLYLGEYFEMIDKVMEQR